MVDSTKETVTKHIATTPTGPDQNPPPVNMLFPATIDTFREIREAILGEIDNPQVNAKKQGAAIDALLQYLQSVIDKDNSRRVQEVADMKTMLATQEQYLAQMIQAGKSQNMQAS